MMISQIGALKIADYAAWCTRVHAAMVKHGGGFPEAAAELGVSVRTLHRWLEEPAFLQLRTPRAPASIKRKKP